LSSVPQPEEIYDRTKKEGERRLRRPLLEIISTALAAGFDIVAGVVALVLVEAQLEHWMGRHAAHVFASLAFGVGFVFLVVGRGELFTENFLVPLAGLDRSRRETWWGLARLWGLSPIFNVIAGVVMVTLLSVHSVLPYGTGATAARVAETIYANGTLALFISAVFAGSLITAMTWFVEGQTSMLVRIVVSWLAASILALGAFDHVIVATLELVFGIRFGAHVPWSFVAGNFFLAAAGNMIGGIGLVTLNRFTQARQSAKVRASA
jgi:formate/nitrite transporter FocA (FNT family)